MDTRLTVREQDVVRLEAGQLRFVGSMPWRRAPDEVLFAFEDGSSVVAVMRETQERGTAAVYIGLGGLFCLTARW